MLRGVLFFLAGLLVLTACGGSGGSGGSESSSGGGSPSSPDEFEVDLTFAPMSGGFQIGNQSDFGDMISLKIMAISESGIEVGNIDTAEFIDGIYDFLGLDDQSNWTFRIMGTLSDGKQQEVVITFVWDENRIDHNNGGIRTGVNMDGDGRADTIDEDDDNDGVNDNLDLCPTGATGWESTGNTDIDGDGCRDDHSEDRDRGQGIDDDNDGHMNDIDIDDDGDGLIEIGTAAELDAVRYALNGRGIRLLGGAALNTTGCGGADGISSCSGYELVRDISLVAYANADGGKGWQPLGNDTASSTDGCQGDPFDGTFEGNGRMISGLSINRPDQDCVGLFGSIAANSEIRNLKLRAERVVGKLFVGGLVGDGSLARIHSSSVEVGEVSGRNNIGGLVGEGSLARIHSSSVVAAEVSGRIRVGGLIGNGQSANITSSSVETYQVSGALDHVGGLVGNGQSARINYSSVVAAEVSGRSRVGGLVGDGEQVQFFSSWVEVGEVIGMRRSVVGANDYVGGLVGNGEEATIISSSVVAGNVTATNFFVGGLIGNGKNARIYFSSVVADQVIGDKDNVGGLVGGGESARIFSSSAVVDEVKGGDDFVGGLVGNGRSARIFSSSVVVDEVNGRDDFVGGLVGNGRSARIFSSSAVVDEVNGGDDFVGGLVGNGQSANITSSSVVAGSVIGDGDEVGGLVGNGESARIFSSSVVTSEVSGRYRVGGLVGEFSNGRVAYSYVVSGSNTDMLIGRIRAGTAAVAVASYWDNLTSGVETSRLGVGSGRSTSALQMPTSYGEREIYAAWDDATDIFGDGEDEPSAVWCDKDYSGSIEEEEQDPNNLIWDFGTSSEYPAIRCTPITPDDWRDWWSLDQNDKPTLNQNRLDDLLP